MSHKVIVLRVGCEPVVEVFDAGAAAISLASMQSVVDGYIERIVLAGEPVMGDSVDLWINEEGRLQNLRANRLILAPHHGEVVVHGDCFIAAGNPEGDTVGLSDEQIDEWTQRVARWRTFEVYGGRN